VIRGDGWNAMREALADRIRTRLGLVFEGTRRHALDTAIERVCSRQGCAPETVGARLETDPTTYAALVDELTIGESFFFRDARHFAPFVDRLRTHGRARVWSAGCAAGEEPYSLAIAALECLGEAGVGGVEIWGSDVSSAALARATTGRYREWALRGLAPELRDRYFRSDGAELVLDARARAMVQFFPANLLERTPAWPSELDVLYCRNVLIYFGYDEAQHVLRSLATCLAAEGRLVLGPSDPQPSGGDLELVREHGFTAWRRRSSQPAISPAPVPAPTPRAPVRTAPRPKPPAPRRHSPAPRDRPASPSLGEQARSLADAGRTDDAILVATRAIDRDPSDVSSYLVRAAAQQQAGMHAAAVRDARRALLLDDSVAYAHLVRAASELALGRREPARRSLRRARRLLEQHNDAVASPMDHAELASVCASLEAAVDREAP
jgi:chemotaxis protein methyltransferase CheR